MISNARNILHVDDDVSVTKLIAKRLEAFGYQVTSLNDPQLVMPYLSSASCRLVLLDIDMPQQDGLELLDEIKNFDGGLQVIMLTGMVSVGTMLRSLRLGAEACFFKPIVDIEPLTAALDDAFRKIDRWWLSLEELSQRRKVENALTRV